MVRPQEEQQRDNQDHLKNEDDGERIGSRSNSQMNREEKMSSDDHQENRCSEDEERPRDKDFHQYNISIEDTDDEQLQIFGSRVGRT